MQLRNQVAVVTGGANGIGRALCRRFVAEQARAVVVSDIDLDAAVAVARPPQRRRALGSEALS